MNNATLSISSISLENNYIKVEGTIDEPKSEEPTQKEQLKESFKGRLMVSFYPKNVTTFNIEQEAQITEKGTIYVNIFVISNHMGPSFRIEEESIGLVKNGPLGEPYTPATFTDFMTKHTGI